MVGLTIGVFKSFGFTFTPGIALGQMGFIVIRLWYSPWTKMGIGNSNPSISTVGLIIWQLKE